MYQKNDLASIPLNAERVILVDASDQCIGTAEKNSAHLKALLHRAFSIFIFNNSGEILLQQRADEKYHSPGLWANSCCGHPMQGELTKNAAERRLGEELGFSVSLTWHNSFIYSQKVSETMTEHEYVHLYSGHLDATFSRLLPNPNPSEIKALKWIGWHSLQQSIQQNEHLYSAWLVHYLREHHDKIQQIVNRFNRFATADAQAT